jgi:hypothetical protein
MPEDQQEQKAYEARLTIEERMYSLLDNGFSISEVEEFVEGIIEQMLEEKEAEEAEEDED